MAVVKQQANWFSGWGAAANIWQANTATKWPFWTLMNLLSWRRGWSGQVVEDTYSQIPGDACKSHASYRRVRKFVSFQNKNKNTRPQPRNQRFALGYYVFGVFQERDCIFKTPDSVFSHRKSKTKWINILRILLCVSASMWQITVRLFSWMAGVLDVKHCVSAL